jgi:hypothetical protein
MVLVLALAGCAEHWEPDSYPAEAVVLSEVTDAQRKAIVSGLETWNARLGRPVFTVRFAKGERPACGQINVLVTENLVNEGANVVGEADVDGWRQCQATVRLRPESKHVVTHTVSHELGHVMLGTSHSDDPGSIMFWAQEPYQVITEEDASEALAVIESRSE